MVIFTENIKHNQGYLRFHTKEALFLQWPHLCTYLKQNQHVNILIKSDNCYFQITISVVVRVMKEVLCCSLLVIFNTTILGNNLCSYDKELIVAGILRISIGKFRVHF